MPKFSLSHVVVLLIALGAGLYLGVKRPAMVGQWTGGLIKAG